MEKDELIKRAQELHQGAFDANTYYLIMLQYYELDAEYKSEIRVSPAFYHTVYNALMIACFMEIAKLYDRSAKSFSIGALLKACKENIALFPDDEEFPYELKREEECFFEKEVEDERRFQKLFDFAQPGPPPVTVWLTFPKFLCFQNKRFRSLSKIQANIQKQRNKIYAHNDEESIMNIDAITKKYPVSHYDMKQLIDFALRLTGCIIKSLTGSGKPTKYANIRDWQETLKLVKQGLIYEQLLFAESVAGMSGGAMDTIKKPMTENDKK